MGKIRKRDRGGEVGEGGLCTRVKLKLRVFLIIRTKKIENKTYILGNLYIIIYIINLQLNTFINM